MTRQYGSIPFDVRAKRERLKLNQSQFWEKVGATQSAGSRYEAGRKIPKPLATLLTITFGTKKQADHALKQLRTHAGGE